MMKMLSLVIPCYNAGAYIGEHLQALLEFLSPRFPQFEILCDDDGSNDDTRAVVERWAMRDPHIVLLPAHKNTGKGGAVKRGVEAARGDHVLFTDADLPYELDAIETFVEALRECDVVLGARQDDGKVRGQEVHRTLLSRLFAGLANLVLRESVPDTQAGFKGFTREAAARIFAEVSVRGFCFDVEAIAIAQRMGLRIRNLPVRLVNQEKSTVRVGRDGLQMCLDLIHIFLKHRLNI